MVTDGIILAGGYAKRVGKNKILLKYQGRFLIDHVIDAISPFVTTIYVVSGHYHQDIKAALKSRDNVSVIYNKHYDKGMFSSVKCGVFATQHDMLIVPGDMPLIKPSTIKAILADHSLIRVPIYKGRKGHPLFIHKSLKDALLNEPNTSHLKRFRNKYDVNVIEVDDPGILVDIDTVTDFDALNQNDGRNENGED